jgi:signal transduction histidine kinase
MWANTHGGCEDEEHLWQPSYVAFRRLLDRSPHEAGNHHVPVYFHDSLVGAVRSARPLARKRGVAFVATLAQSSNSDAAVEVLGDPLLLEVMVASAVGNALRAAPEGSHVELEVQVLRESIVLYVRDHGTGTAALESETPHALRSARNSLDLARHVAEYHRGTVSHRSVTNGGSEFRIRLPRWRPEGPPPLRSI